MSVSVCVGVCVGGGGGTRMSKKGCGSAWCLTQVADFVTNLAPAAAAP